MIQLIKKDIYEKEKKLMIINYSFNFIQFRYKNGHRWLSYCMYKEVLYETVTLRFKRRHEKVFSIKRFCRKPKLCVK